jgi:hypothetical protein
VVRVRENYHSGLLIGNDSKMNGRLNSEATGRKTLRTVDFSAAGQRPRAATPDATSFEVLWLLGVLPGEILRLSVFVVRALVHDLNQALHDGGESGALELCANRG